MQQQTKLTSKPKGHVVKKSGLVGGNVKVEADERYFEWPNGPILAQLSEDSRIDTISFRGGDALYMLNWKYNTNLSSPFFGHNIALGTSSQTQGLKFPRGQLTKIEIKAVGNNSEFGFVQSIKFFVGDGGPHSESLGLNTHGNNTNDKKPAPETKELVVEADAVVIGFYGTIRVSDGRFKNLGVIFKHIT